MLGINEKTIRRWECEYDDFVPHASHQKSIFILQALAQSLSDSIELDTIKIWVDRPNRMLQGETPRNFVKKPGGLSVMAHLLSAKSAQ